MKTIVFDKAVILSNLKKNIHIMVAILLLFALVGIMLGIYQKNTYKARKDKPYMGEAYISTEGIDKDGAYYFRVYDRIKREINCLDLYFIYFQNVEMSAYYRDELNKVKITFNEFNEEYMKEEYFFWNNPLTLSTVDDTVSYYSYLADDLSDKREVLETDYKGGKDPEKLSDKEKELYQDQIDSIDYYIKKLNDLVSVMEKSSNDEISANNAKADKSIDRCISELNAIIDDYNRVMRQISESEDYEILYNKYMFTDQESAFGLLNLKDKNTLLSVKKNEAIAYAKSKEGLDIGMERFYAMVAFFVLFGIIVSVTIGALYEPKNNRKR